MPQDSKPGEDTERSLVEWIAGGLGLALTLAILGFVGWQAVQAPEDVSPQIEVRATSVAGSGEGHVVEIKVVNKSPRTAAGVLVEGTLSQTGKPVEKSSTTFDYVPGESEVRGGLFFEADPLAGELQIRSLGYEDP